MEKNSFYQRYTKYTKIAEITHDSWRFTAQRLMSLLPLPLGAAPAENMDQKGWEWEIDERRSFCRKYQVSKSQDWLCYFCITYVWWYHVPFQIAIWGIPKFWTANSKRMAHHDEPLPAGAPVTSIQLSYKEGVHIEWDLNLTFGSWVEWNRIIDTVWYSMIQYDTVKHIHTYSKILTMMYCRIAMVPGCGIIF